MGALNSSGIGNAVWGETPYQGMVDWLSIVGVGCVSVPIITAMACGLAGIGFGGINFWD